MQPNNFKLQPKSIALYCSGSGTNAEKIMEHFANSDLANVCVMISDKPQAYALQRAAKYGVPTCVLLKNQITNGTDQLLALSNFNPDFIVLAGYLRLIPQQVTDMYQNRIINIHPALLPKFGGKGMYGMHVHQAVKQSGDTQSGITIHLVNQNYDEGKVLFQAQCPVLPTDTPNDIAANVQKLEHLHFPKVIEQYILHFNN